MSHQSEIILFLKTRVLTLAGVSPYGIVVVGLVHQDIFKFSAKYFQFSIQWSFVVYLDNVKLHSFFGKFGIYTVDVYYFSTACGTAIQIYKNF